jgi:uncharacterized protein YqkB
MDRRVDSENSPILTKSIKGVFKHPDLKINKNPKDA